TIRHSISGF
ncbi:ATP-dependent helicase HrpA, partial [Vibrio parahaemolyticus VP2007-007]